MEGYHFKIDGPIFKDGVPVNLAVESLDHFHSIIDKTYMVAVGARRLSSKDRKRYYLKATEFRRGSFLTTFEIALQSVQLTLPLVSSFGPQHIWSYTKESFNLLKLLCETVQAGQTPVIHRYKDNENVCVHIGNTEQHYHGPVIQIAEMSHQSWQELAQLLNISGITEISAGRQKSNTPDMYLGKNDKNAFDIPIRTEEKPVTLEGEIYDLNKYKNIGRLQVHDDRQEIPPGNYRFTIAGDQDNQDYIFSMLKTQVRLSCFIEHEITPFGEERVSKLHITGVEP